MKATLATLFLFLVLALAVPALSQSQVDPVVTVVPMDTEPDWRPPGYRTTWQPPGYVSVLRNGDFEDGYNIEPWYAYGPTWYDFPGAMGTAQCQSLCDRNDCEAGLVSNAIKVSHMMPGDVAYMQFCWDVETDEWVIAPNDFFRLSLWDADTVEWLADFIELDNRNFIPSWDCPWYRIEDLPQSGADNVIVFAWAKNNGVQPTSFKVDQFTFLVPGYLTIVPLSQRGIWSGVMGDK